MDLRQLTGLLDILTIA